MKTDTELEALLRETFTGKAETVRDARRWVAPARAPRRIRRWLPALAAAVTVVLVAAGVLIGVHLTRSDHKVIKHQPVPTVCPTSLPAQWSAALNNDVLAGGGRTAGPIAVAPDGSVIALRDDGVHPGDGREIVQLRPGSQPKVLYAMPNPDKYSERAAYLVDHWLFIGEGLGGRPPKHTIPGSSPIGLATIVVVDLDTGQARTLATAGDPGRDINSLAVLDGLAYWDERPSYAARNGVVRSYDPRTGKAATIYRGRVSWLQATGAGLVFYDDLSHPLVTAQLPAVVESAMSSFTRRFLVTDGNAYAWLASRTVIAWWAPGNAAPIYHRFDRPLASDYRTLSLLVAGRFVLTPDERVIDAVSGAAARLFHHPGYLSATTSIGMSRGGVLAGTKLIERKGHWIDGYWAEAATAVVRVDTRALPALHC